MRVVVTNSKRLCELLLVWPEEIVALWVMEGGQILVVESAHEKEPLPLIGEPLWREVLDKEDLIARAMIQFLREEEEEEEDSSHYPWWPSEHTCAPLLPEEGEPLLPEKRRALCEAWARVVIVEMAFEVGLIAKSYGINSLLEAALVVAEDVTAKVGEDM